MSQNEQTRHAYFQIKYIEDLRPEAMPSQLQAKITAFAILPGYFNLIGPEIL